MNTQHIALTDALRRATEAEAAFLAANVKIAELEKKLNTPTA